jgi:hypothetical protein
LVCNERREEAGRPEKKRKMKTEEENWKEK